MTDTSHGLSAQQVASIEAEAKQMGAIRHYRAMIRRGESPRMAIMLLARKVPGTSGTDNKFQQYERERVSHDYTDTDMARIHKLAKAAGVSTTGKTYNGALGRYGDHHAWVSDTSDVRTAAKEKGLSLRGTVNVQNEPKPLKRKALSDRLVNEAERRLVSADPALAERCRKKPSARKELREKIIHKHGSKLPKQP